MKVGQFRGSGDYIHTFGSIEVLFGSNTVRLRSMLCNLAATELSALQMPS